MRIEDRRVSLDLPPNVDLDECQVFQHRMARLDGVESIADDGTVTFTQHVIDTLTPIDERLCAPLRIGDISARYELLRDALAV